MFRRSALCGCLAAALPAVAAEPVLALLETSPHADRTFLVLQPVAGPVASPAAVVEHAPGGVARGAVAPGSGAVYAAVDLFSHGDLSWAGSLVRMTPGTPSVALADRVAHATRPIVLADGRVLVQRGWAGPPLRGAMRVDELTIDEIDASGRARSLHRTSGYAAYLAGALGNDAVVYRVGPSGADLVLVNAETQAVRVLAPSLPPFARDFSVDAASRTLFFTERDDRDPGLWWAERLDLGSGERTRLGSAPQMAIFPHAWPGGAIALNPGGPHGLVVLGGPKVSRPFGDGGDELRAVSPDGAWIAGMHSVPGQPEAPFVLHADGSGARRVPVPAGAWVDVLGFVPERAP